MKTSSLSLLTATVCLLSLSPLSADQLPLTPVLESTTGLAGKQTKLVWSPQSNVRYRVEKSTSLSSDGAGAWSTRALVEGGESLDPEPPGTRAFYRVPAPQPEVFSVYPTVLGPAGTMLTIEGQCLPAESSLVLEIEGAPPLLVPLQLGQAGTYRAVLPAGAVVPGASVVSAVIRGPNEVVLLDIKENFTVTPTGRADDTPPTLPPVLSAWVETVWNKQCVEKDTTVRLADQDYMLKRPPQIKLTWGTLQPRPGTNGIAPHAGTDEGEGEGQPDEVCQQFAYGGWRWR